MKKGYALLNDPFLNKGTAFTETEREQYGLVGILPPTVQSLEEQASQVYANVEKKPNVTEKRHYLMNIFSRNRTLFFRVFKEHIAEFMPIVYDPGIAESIRGYSEFCNAAKRGLSFHCPSRTDGNGNPKCRGRP